MRYANMDATKRSRNSMVGVLALVLWALTQSSLCSADVSTRAEVEVRTTVPKFPAFSFPSLPQFSFPPIPQVQLRQLPHLPLPPLPSQVTLPCLNVPQFSLPPLKPRLKPLAVPGLHPPPLPQPNLPIPSLPGIQLPFTTVLPLLSSLLIPKISIPSSLSARTLTILKVNPADLTVPSDISLPPTTTLTLPPPVVVPTFRGFPRRAGPGARAQTSP